MKAYSLNRAAAVAFAVSAAGCGAGAGIADDGASAPLLAAADSSQGGAEGAGDSAAQGTAAEPQSSMVAQRHFVMYQRFHGLPSEESAAQGHAADMPRRTSDGSAGMVCRPAADTDAVSSGE